MFEGDHGARVGLETGFKRSAAWPAARRLHLQQWPWCVACQSPYQGLLAALLRPVFDVRVHHIFPFHVVQALDRPDLECDSRNLVTLCGAHHFLIGHLGDWDSFNPHVKHLALRFFGRPAKGIPSDPEYQRFRDERKRDIRFLTGSELAAIRIRLDEKFPRQPV